MTSTYLAAEDTAAHQIGTSPAKADFSKTCEGCGFIKTEKWTPTKTAFRCFAPGSTCGYVVGVERFLPYIPAWCPKNKEEA